MENVLTIFDYANETINDEEEIQKPQWARSKMFSRALRFAKAYHNNENWLNSIEALMKRYGINQNEIN